MMRIFYKESMSSHKIKLILKPEIISLRKKAMKTIRILPFLLIMILAGCTFHIEKPFRKERSETPKTVIVKTAKDQSVNQDSIIYMVVEIPASYTGGDEAMYRYLSQNLKYPAAAKKAQIEGTVYVQFVVEKDGSLSDIKIMHGDLGGGCEEAAMEAIKNMPKWNPGTQKGKPVRSIFILPVQFKL